MIPDRKYKTRQIIFIICLIPFLLGTAWCGYHVYHDSNTRAAMKDDFMNANSIVHGIFSVNKWREELKAIMLQEIENFELTEEQDSVLRLQMSSLLNTMITEAKTQVQQNDGSLKKKLRKWAVNAVVDWENLRDQVPAFTDGIMNDLTSEASKERLKLFATQKFEEYANQVYDDTLSTYLTNIYAKYDQNSLDTFNVEVAKRTQRLESKAYNFAYIMLAVVAFFLLLWGLAYKRPELRKPLFFMSALLALIVLVTGLASPMIEIDARIKEVDFVLLSSHIEFNNQMLFYRSKSILQIVSLMIFDSRQIDSKLVGFLILAFSVILPISKLISTQIYLLAKGRIRENKLVQWLAFRSGKWSMADVMVVAIFMSYVGFDGIMDSQLKHVERDTETLSSITTNLTSLQPGFMLFLAFVLYGLILAAILKKITPTPKSV